MIRTRRAYPVGALAAFMLCLTTSTALGNASDDVYGVGARSMAMAGTGTAAARDYSATYYNPANLTLCKRRQLSVTAFHVFYDIGTDVDVSELPTVDDPFNPGETIIDPELVPIEPENRTRIQLGVCLPLPANLAIGLNLGFGVQTTASADPNTVAENPRYYTYGPEMDTLTLQTAIAYRPIPQLAIGLGATVLLDVQSGATLTFDILSTDPADATAIIRADLTPRIAPIVGIYAKPIDELELGLTFRGKLDSNFVVPAFISAASGPLAIEVALTAEGRIWYSPNQLSFGIAGRPIDSLLLTADVTWYQTSKAPGPYATVTVVGEVLGNELVFPPQEDYAFRDIVVPRFGIEYTLLDRDALALRGGYMFRPSIAAVPATSEGCKAAAADPNQPACRANLLDNPSHWISVGTGYTFRLGPAPKADNEAAALTVEDTRPELTIDAYFRVGLFKERQVSRTEPVDEVPYLRDYRYGGQTYDLGGTVTLAWK